MWIDERGSEVLPLPECRHLLALGAMRGLVAHLGVPQDGAPLVLPLNYRLDGWDPVIRIGEGLFSQVAEAKLVALEIEGADDGRPWSVLVRGEAIEMSGEWVDAHPVSTQVAEPGHHTVRIRADVVTGRRLRQDSPRVYRLPTLHRGTRTTPADGHPRGEGDVTAALPAAPGPPASHPVR
jgi:nitroimidazol reductase NimA-like FMN-containing flavoprotein (pyridoxamine 5'-phosphate oxidase superfamily)